CKPQSSCRHINNFGFCFDVEEHPETVIEKQQKRYAYQQQRSKQGRNSYMRELDGRKSGHHNQPEKQYAEHQQAGNDENHCENFCNDIKDETEKLPQSIEQPAHKSFEARVMV